MPGELNMETSASDAILWPPGLSGVVTCCKAPYVGYPTAVDGELGKAFGLLGPAAEPSGGSLRSLRLWLITCRCWISYIKQDFRH